MLPQTLTWGWGGVCCRFGTRPMGAISLGVILISTLFFLFISVCCCFQGWRSRKCQPLWMWTVFLCASLECTYSLLLISPPLFSTFSPLSLHLFSLHSVAEMNMHLISAIPKQSGRRDPNGTGAFKHHTANGERDGTTWAEYSGVYCRHCCSLRSCGLL